VFFALQLAKLSETMVSMKRRDSLRLRMIADFVLTCIFGLALPPILAPTGRSWSVLSVTMASFCVSIWCLYDGLRTLTRLRQLHSDQ
jgi:hypothetical protein